MTTSEVEMIGEIIIYNVDNSAICCNLGIMGKNSAERWIHQFFQSNFRVYKNRDLKDHQSKEEKYYRATSRRYHLSLQGMEDSW
jgi:hypothetical protein